MSTVKQDHGFGTAFLESIINWIIQEMTPDEVFPLDDLIKWVREGETEDYFSDDVLGEWAEANGYTKDAAK